MSFERMPRYWFGWASLETIHGWMQDGPGTGGIERATRTLEQIAWDLQDSQASLRAALTEIGVGWEGQASEGASAAFGKSEEWAARVEPIVTDTGRRVEEVGAAFVGTRNGIPSPAEAEEMTPERVAARQVPILGPTLDEAIAEKKRDDLTREARRRMHEWQESAGRAVDSVCPLPAVPDVVVRTPQPRESITGRPVDEPGQTRSVGVTPGTPNPVAPPGTPPSSPGVPAPTLPPPGGPGGPGGQLPNVPTPPPPPGGQVPGPGAPGPGPSPAPRAPGVVLPPPVGAGGPGEGSAAGRRPAFGPGAFSREEIGRARGGGPAGRGGTIGAAPNTGGAAARPGTAAGGNAGTGRGAGSWLSPAAGRGSGGDEDKEHNVKYADKTDEQLRRRHSQGGPAGHRRLSTPEPVGTRPDKAGTRGERCATC